jgi:LPXTG-site transpeptidase (sortase) family protein
VQRGRRNSSINPLSLIILGVFGAVAFLIFTTLSGGGDDDDTAATAVVPTTVAEATADIQPTVEDADVTAVAPGGGVIPPPNVPTNTPELSVGLYSLEDAQIIIPAAAINAPVIQSYITDGSWDVSNLGMNVGHLQGTTWLGRTPGNIVLSGHVEMRDGRRGVFAGLEDLPIGTLVILRQGDVERQYEIIEINSVDPANLDPVRPTSSERLTLITCENYDFFQNAYLDRIVVVAEPIG